MKNINKSIIKWLFILLPFIGFQYEALAQCNIQISGAVCAGQPTQYSVNSPGATNVNWDFAGTLINNELNPSYAFPAPGQYQVKVTLTTATGQPCTSTITITVRPRPKADWRPVAPTTQCFLGNKFCIEDISTPAAGSKLKRSTVVLAATNITRQNPINPYQICVSTADPQGGYYSLDIEVEDTNGCIDNVNYADTFLVRASLFLSFTSNQPRGCDSVLMKVKNTSLIPFNQVSSFIWDFGDGTTNTTDWDSVWKWYYTQGPNNGSFTTTLTVTDIFGCTEVYSFPSSATNLLLIGEIQSLDSTCSSDNPVTFSFVPGLPPNASSFMWNFGNPPTGPMNFNFNSLTAPHAFSELGPFLISFTYQHPICGTRVVYKQYSNIGPVSVIPGPGVPINQRYQCRPERDVYFPNESAFFHNDINMANDASGYFDADSNINGWHYYFDSASPAQLVRDPMLSNRGNYGTYKCVYRLWNFDDDYAPKCTTDSRPIYPQSPNFNNLHLPPDPVTGLYPKNTYDANGDWINCNFSNDSLPFHRYPDWDSVYLVDFYQTNQTFSYSYFNPLDQKCYQRQVDSSEQPLHKELFFIEEPRCNLVTLFHQDTCHAFKCESRSPPSPICILPPDASGMYKDGAFCFGGPPLYGVIFILDQTKPGASMLWAEINPDTALNPNGWIPFLPGGLTGTPQAPSPIFPYPMSGPYPNRLLHFYPNPGTIADDSTGYAHVGLVIGNGGCFDTVYYHKFLKFPILDPASEILKPTEPLAGWANVYKLCINDTIVIRPTLTNRTVETDVDEIMYRLTRIAPDANADSRFGDYTYVYFENYEWYKPVSGQTYLENYLTKTVNRIKGSKRDTIAMSRDTIGRVYKYTMRADVSQVRTILSALFDAIGFNMARMSEEEIAQILAAKCVDTTGLGRFITFDYSRDSFESFHYRDTSITPMDDFLDDDSIIKKAYTFIAEENGIFDLVFAERSRIGGCVSSSGYRVLIGFYNKLTVSDSILCRQTPVTLDPYFRYFHVDPNNPLNPPPPWQDLTDYWTLREGQAGTKGIEGFTKWDWSKQDDDTLNPVTIFGDGQANPAGHPYAWQGYSTDNFDAGGPLAGATYYQDSGFYTMRLVGEDSTGCSDTLYQNIYATRVIAKFKLDNELAACVNIVDFFDSSYVVDPCNKPTTLNKQCDSIIRWRIDWGDNKREDQFNRNTYPPFKGNTISHNYTRNGTFIVRLIVDSELGCSDTLIDTLTIQGPIPEFFVLGDTSICAGDSIHFANISGNITPGSQWIWIFGDKIAKSEDFITKKDSFWHTYKTPGTFEVYLSMYDSVKATWCGFTYPDTTDGSQDKIKIIVNDKDTVKLAANRDTICPGESVNFVVSGTDTGFVEYIAFNWNYNAANVPPNPSHIRRTTGNNKTQTTFQFTETGVYKISVEGEHDPNFPDRCPHSDTIIIVVMDVTADFEIDSTKRPNFCFTNTSTGGVRHKWGFFHENDITPNSDEHFEDIETNESQVCRNFAEYQGQFYVCLIAENEIGCRDTICKPVSNHTLIHIPNVFTPKRGGGGDGFNDVFEIPILGHDLFEITIRNRWGDIVFKSTSSDIHWNGQVDNTGVECPDGTYFYMISYRFKGFEETVETNGVVQLIWEK